MSQSPADPEQKPREGYFDAWQRLATRIRNGNSFSGREPNSFFLNTQGGRFADASFLSGLGLTDDGRALAAGDWDRDGDIDLWVTNRTAPRVRFLRNDIQERPPFVALRLEGDPAAKVNRDAIGASVTLTLSDGQRRVKQLTAGDGFLSQSSKWLHFGLGKATAIRSVHVTWPGVRQAEAIKGVMPNGWFRVRQGSGRAQRHLVRPLDVKAVPLALPDPSSNAFVKLTEPVPAPALRYQTWLGDAAQVDTNQPILTLLWASWCPACRRELSRFIQEAKSLQQAGVQILALNIEEAQAAVEGTEAPATLELQAYLKAMAWPFGSGRAGKELVSILDEAQRMHLYKQEPMPLPSAFLWNGGKLVSFSKGETGVKALLEEWSRLQSPTTPHPDHALPFSGRWSTDHFATHPVAIAQTYFEGGYYDQAETYVRDALSNLKTTDPTKRAFQEADLHFMIGEALRLKKRPPGETLPLYEEAVRLNPNHQRAVPALAKTLLATRQGPKAVALLTSFVKRYPNRADVHVQLGNVHQGLFQDAQAVAAYRMALQNKPNDFEALNQLCWVLATTSDVKVFDAQQALNLAQAIVKAHGNNHFALDTAAAALAAHGQHAKAVQFAQRAAGLALKAGQRSFANEVRQRMALYQKEKRYQRHR